jgi:hypothetical protein
MNGMLANAEVVAGRVVEAVARTLHAVTHRQGQEARLTTTLRPARLSGAISGANPGYQNQEDVEAWLDPVHVSSTRPLESGVRRVHACHTLTAQTPVLKRDVSALATPVHRCAEWESLVRAQYRPPQKGPG